MSLFAPSHTSVRFSGRTLIVFAYLPKLKQQRSVKAPQKHAEARREKSAFITLCVPLRSLRSTLYASHIFIDRRVDLWLAIRPRSLPTLQRKAVVTAHDRASLPSTLSSRRPLGCRPSPE